MKVKFISPSKLVYKGRSFYKGDELEITELFYNSNKSRFIKIDDNFVMDAEFVEIKNVTPALTVEIQNVEPKKAKRKNKGKK